MAKKFLKNDEKHFFATHERWDAKFPRNDAPWETFSDGELAPKECLSCQYYIQLVGLFEKDWGVCSHPVSPFDGRVMFEHYGCEQYSFAEDEEEF